MHLHNDYVSKSKNRITGNLGENLAITYLQNRDYQIIERNVYSRWGEIDIVARRKVKIHFFEVKSRIHTRHGLPFEAVRIPKLSHLMRTIQYYIHSKKLHYCTFQLDVLSLILNHDHTLHSLKHYENVQVDRFF